MNGPTGAAASTKPLKSCFPIAAESNSWRTQHLPQRYGPVPRSFPGNTYDGVRDVQRCARPTRSANSDSLRVLRCDKRVAERQQSCEKRRNRCKIRRLRSSELLSARKVPPCPKETQRRMKY